MSYFARRAARLLIALGGARNPWTGATWAVSGGNAYNTPTLGAEIVVNGGFSADTDWTKQTGWTIAAGVATCASGSNALFQGTLGSGVGNWYRHEIDLTAYTSGSVRSEIGGSETVLNLSGIGIKTQITRLLTASINRPLLRSVSFIGSLDNYSVRQLAAPSLFTTIVGTSSSQTAAAKIATLTTGIQSGVVALLDSANNPQNFLIAYHNGTSVLLDKCVAGVYTNLITATVAFTANAQIEIRRPSGNLFQLWYNGTQRGTDQTVSDAGIINNTLYGLFSTHSGGTFSEFSLGGVVIPFQFPGA